MLSLCIISRKQDEEALKKAIASVYDYVDDIVVVDTGDKPIQLNDPKGITRIIHHKWKNDFSEARNYSFKAAKGNVVLWIDSDDTVIHPEKLPELAKLITDGKCDVIELEYYYEYDVYGNLVMRHWKPRLIRKGIGLWKKSVHENFEYLQDAKRVRDMDVKIDHHTGDAKKHLAENAKRNLDILLAEYNQNPDKTDPRTLYYIGNTLMALERFEEAIPYYAMHIRKCGWPEEKYFSMHYLSHCFAWVGDLEHAINLSLESMKLFPEWSLAYFDLGEYYSVKKDYAKAVEWILSGLQKDTPTPIDYFINDTDYTIIPLGRLAECYIEMHMFQEAMSVAKDLYKKYPKDQRMKDLYEICQSLLKDETFVHSFVNVATRIKDQDRIKAVKLFDLVPTGLDEDVRIQEARKAIVPPKVWEPNSIVFYCHGGLEDWAYPSIFTTGIGGSEETVIRMSQELTKLGFKVTIYNRCGDMRGTYQGVEYIPYYMFNLADSFNVLFAWRYPGMLDQTHPLKAKKLYIWLHDIVSDNIFNDRIIQAAHKILFLSKWHRDNAPSIPENKVYITNNGIEPSEFLELDDSKRRPYSMIYTSSYDRGVLTLLRDIFPQIRKAIPAATLDICYGMANLEKEMFALPHLKELRDEILPLLEQPGVTHHGRISHKKVADLTKTSIMHIYPTEFGETNFIGSQKSQAGGCFVLTTTQSGATPERIRFGEAMQGEGIYSDPAFQKRFTKRAIEILQNPPKLTESARKKILNEFSIATTAANWRKDLL